MTIITRTGKGSTLTYAELDGDILDLDARATANAAAISAKPDALVVVDESSTLSTGATTLVFTGSGVTASGAGQIKTITIPGSGSGGVDVQEEGVALATTATTINFVGTGVTATGTSAVKTVTIPGDYVQNGMTPSSTTKAPSVDAVVASIGVTVQEEGTPLASLGTVLNFVGAGVTASGTGSTKTITIASAGVQDSLTGGSTTLAPSVNATSNGLYQTAPTMLPNAMSALALDMLRAVNTKTITVNSTFTFGSAPATNTYVSWLLTNGGATDLTVTLPASVKSTTTQSTISSFTLPAYAVADMALRYDGTYYWLSGEPMTLPVGFTWSLIGTATDRVYTAVLKSPFAFKITSVTSKCTSGTATATVKIDATALNGNVSPMTNALSSSEVTNAPTSSYTVAADQDVTLTFSSSSTPVDPVITVAGYRT
jgi:hypothetical protein